MNIIQISISTPYKDEFRDLLKGIGFVGSEEDQKLMIKQMDSMYFCAVQNYSYLNIHALSGTFESNKRLIRHLPQFVLEDRWNEIDFNGILSKLKAKATELSIISLVDEIDSTNWIAWQGCLIYQGSEKLSYESHDIPFGGPYSVYKDKAPCAMEDYLSRLVMVGFPISRTIEMAPPKGFGSFLKKMFTKEKKKSV